VRQVQLGLERSADEGNGVFVEGQEVNHQFDKSSAFLAQAQEYIHGFIDPQITVVSTLHGLWEIQVLPFTQFGLDMLTSLTLNTVFIIDCQGIL
jgi:hypothetical protein